MGRGTNFEVNVGIVGIQRNEVTEPEVKPEVKVEEPESTVEEESRSRGKEEVDYFSGSELLSEGHYKKMVERNKTQAKRRNSIVSRVKKIHKQASELPMQKIELGEENMLMLLNRSKANKTVVVGHVAIVFNDRGVGSIHKKDVFAYNALIRKPGYTPYTGEKIAAQPTPVVVEEKPVEEPVAEPEPEVEEELEPVEETVVEEEPEDEPEPEDEEESVEYDEVSAEEMAFEELTVGDLQEVMKATGVSFKASDRKPALVEKISDAWNDGDDDFRAAVDDALAQGDE